MTATFKIWAKSDVDGDTWIPRVEDALNQLDSQVNYSIETWDMSGYITYSEDKASWSDYLEDFANHVIEYYGEPFDRDYHMLIINDPWGNPGAGMTKGTVNYPNPSSRNYFQKAGCSDCLAAIGGVNVGVNNYEATFRCYGGDGYKAFKQTVIHNAIHGLCDESHYESIDKYCSQDHSGDHALGEITWSGMNAVVSPAQMWYTANWCSGNNPPCANCNNTEDMSATGMSNQISICTQNRLEKHAADFDL